MKKKYFLIFIFCAVAFFFAGLCFARSGRVLYLSAKSAVILDIDSGKLLYAKNPHLRLPPASTAKMMTALIVLERLPLTQKVVVGQQAVNATPSKAGLSLGAEYFTKDLLIACLVASSNDAAIALSEAIAGSEDDFVELMNEKAKALGMVNTQFVNSTGLPNKRKKQYSTAYDLAILMRVAARNSIIDHIMGLMSWTFCGNDGKTISIRTHNKMLWKAPNLIKGKTGWTIASRHTFIGTNYSANKKITFAMLSSVKPWADIAKLANYGLFLKQNKANLS